MERRALSKAPREISRRFMRYKILLPGLLLGFLLGPDATPEAILTQVSNAEFERHGFINKLPGVYGGCGLYGICQHQKSNGLYGGYLGFTHGWKNRKHTGYEHGTGYHQTYGSRFGNLHGHGLWHGFGLSPGLWYGNGFPIYYNDHSNVNGEYNSRYGKGYGNSRAHVPPEHEHYRHRLLGIHYTPVYVPGYYSEGGHASKHSLYGNNQGGHRNTYGHREALVHGPHGFSHVGLSNYGPTSVPYY